jgi:hypothetical protein
MVPSTKDRHSQPMGIGAFATAWHMSAITMEAPMPEGLMDTGSRIVAAFEAAWCSIQAKHAQVPDVVMITGPMRRGKGDDYLGYRAPDRWQLAAEAAASWDLRGWGSPKIRAAASAFAPGRLPSCQGVIGCAKRSTRC